MEQGWIKLHRQVYDNILWQDKPFSKGQAWIDLILMANFADSQMLTKGTVVNIKRGQVFRTQGFLANRWGWSIKKVRGFITLLENQKMATAEGIARGTLITIENYSLFQDEGQANGTSEDIAEGRQRAGKGRQNKNNKKNNNENNIIYNADPQLDAAIKEFVAFRKKIKKPMTDHAVKLMINKLGRLSSDVNEQIEILNQSILNGWQGIFPLKEPAKPANKKPVCGENGVEIDETKNDLDDLF